MTPLDNLLSSIEACTECELMAENKTAGIPYVPILSKPNAKVVFIGRDPSPRTASIVGVRGGTSVFINTIFKMVDKAGTSEDKIYITDLCKCHWRTSVGTPLPQTEYRQTSLDKEVANTCLAKWLVREIEILTPTLIVAFGEELYQILRPMIVEPVMPPEKLSASKDKSILDGEKWLVTKGLFEIKIGTESCPLAVLRHPGNSSRLPKQSEQDKRRFFHERAASLVIDLIKQTEDIHINA